MDTDLSIPKPHHHEELQDYSSATQSIREKLQNLSKNLNCAQTLGLYVFFAMQTRSQSGLVKPGHLPQAKSMAKRRFFILGLALGEEMAKASDEQHPGVGQTLPCAHTRGTEPVGCALAAPCGDIGVPVDVQRWEGIAVPDRTRLTPSRPFDSGFGMRRWAGMCAGTQWLSCPGLMEKLTVCSLPPPPPKLPDEMRGQ